MSLTWESIQGNAIAFVTRWKDASNEEAQAQSFTTDFLKVFGIDDPEKTGDFEYKVSLDEGRTGYIDYLWKKKLAIEMKSRGKDLNKAYTQLRAMRLHLLHAGKMLPTRKHRHSLLLRIFLKFLALMTPKKQVTLNIRFRLMKGVQDTLIIFGRRNLPLK